MPLALGSRRELFVDDYLLETLSGQVGLQLHSPTPQEVVLTTDQPWEGCMNAFNSVFLDGDRFRLYYRGWHVNVHKDTGEGEGLVTLHDPTICLAESVDGIHWERLQLGHIPYEGAPHNNIVWMAEGWHGFAAFKDPNPAATPEARYKAVGIADAWPSVLLAFVSPDGIHWNRLRAEPIITTGKFDSQNLVFWDGERGEYRAYVRDKRNGLRDIRTATSPDFITWSEPQFIDYTHVEPEELYTNNVHPYHRAPHLLIGYPARYVERPWTPTMEQLPELDHRRLRSDLRERYGTATSDAVFMSSRDGQTFRRWGEAFIRPGLRDNSWTYGDIYPAWGLIETASPFPGGGKELSMFASEGYWRGNGSSIRRYTLRLDGFVSVHAKRRGGELHTKPLTFSGSRLSFNISTSAAGGAKVELQDADGWPLPGYTLDDCWEIVGDTTDYTVTWKNGSDLSGLAGKPVRLRIALNDADLYAMQVAE